MACVMQFNSFVVDCVGAKACVWNTRSSQAVQSAWLRWWKCLIVLPPSGPSNALATSRLVSSAAPDGMRKAMDTQTV